MEIYFSGNNREEVIQIPVVPEIEEINCETKDEEFETVNRGTLLLIGSRGIREFTLSSFFPNKNYPFLPAGAVADSEYYRMFFEKWRDRNVPVRVVIIDKGHEILNMPCRFSFHCGVRDRAGDVPYTLEIREYVFAEEGMSGG